MKAIQVGIVGFGTVGSGVVKIIRTNRGVIKARLGVPLVVKRIADLDITTARAVKVNPHLLTTRVDDILDDPTINIVVELIGGFEPAKNILLRAMERGKHVVTANKALLAEHGGELFEAAHRKKVDVGFEGSVAGGVPIIKIVKEGLSANHINFILGILNGTSNYILSEMTNEGGRFKDILREAQRQGFAESDATLDIEGVDTAHKLAILITLAYGAKINFRDIYREGISKIEPLDIEFAKELGYRIKLLAISRQRHKQVEARVHPTLIPATHLLSKVEGTYNAVFIEGNAIGPSMFYGRGAGMMPAASAVVSDILDIARNIRSNISQRVPLLSYQREFLEKAKVKDIQEVVTRYYLRFTVIDRPGVLSRISGILGKHHISIHSVVQKGRRIKGAVPIFLLTHEAREADVKKALNEIDRLSITKDKTVLIRMEDQI